MENTGLWNGFAYEKFIFEEHEAIVAFPEKGTENGQLAVKTEYWDAFPHAAEVELLRQGFHLCYIRNDNRWGMNDDLDRKARFVRWVQEKFGLGTKCVPVGMSCGGLIAIKFAARYPELMACLYLDAPVLNYMSCPCGFGVGIPLPNDPIGEILGALQLDSISELLMYREMPMDQLPRLIETQIPVVMVAGDSDRYVPYCENGIALERAYRAAGVPLEVYMKPGCDHHPHGLEDPTPVIQFIQKYTAQ